MITRSQARGRAQALSRLVGILVLVFASRSALAQTSVDPNQRAPGIESTLDYVPGEVIVKLKGQSKTIQSQAFVGKAVSEKSMTLKGSWAGLNMHHFALKSGQSVEAALSDLRQDPDVEYAEPNFIVRRQSTGIEGEPVALGDIRELSVTQRTAYSQTTAPVQLSNAWSAETPSLTPPVVAVIDTGIDMTHDVFTESHAIYTNPRETLNGIDDDGNGYIDDIHGWNFVANSNSPQDDDGHGTHVSGIILGTTQDINSVPMEEARIKIMPLKFLDANGSGSTSDAVKAIYYAVNNGAKVLNNSWGGGGYSRSLLDAIAYSYDHKVLFVAAAGNASTNNDSSPIYPANYDVPSLISVAATSDTDAFASFSNYGKQTVHMGSPGVSIWSTYPGNQFARLSGTSMATPFVSGLAALVMRESPTMNGYQAKAIVVAAAQQITALQTKTTSKARLNVFNGVVAAKTATVSPDQPSYVATYASRDVASVDNSVPGGCGLVAKAVYGAKEGGGPSGPQPLGIALVVSLILAPLALGVFMRSGAKQGRDKRKHERFVLQSSVTMKLGDRELTGQVSTISQGGVQVNTDALLEHGGIVKMSISSPDGKDQIEVEGRVVWSEEKKSYGVAFSNANEPVRSAIARWTSALMKAQ